MIRTQAGIAAGELAGLLVTLHSGSARTDHFHLLNGSVPRLLEQSAAVSRLEAEVVAGLELYPERFARARARASRRPRTSPTPAQEGGLDYRTAHRVVGRAVRDLVDKGLRPTRSRPSRSPGPASDRAKGRHLRRTARGGPGSGGRCEVAAADRLVGAGGRVHDRERPPRRRRRAARQRGGAGGGGGGADGACWSRRGRFRGEADHRSYPPRVAVEEAQQAGAGHQRQHDVAGRVGHVQEGRCARS